MRPEHWLFTIPLRLRSLFRWAQADQELDDELRDHLERKTDEYVANRMAPEEARRQARLDLDGIEQTKEKCRDARRVNWIQDFVQDLRYGLRNMRKSPGFTCVAVLTLALGIGANTAVFAVMNGVLLRPMPFPEADRLLLVSLNSPWGPFEWQPGVSDRHYLSFREQDQAFEHLASFARARVSLTGAGDPVELPAAQVTTEFFATLRTNPEFGRSFSAEEDQAGRDNVVVLSNELWKERFGLDPQILGKTIRLDGIGRTVIGIMPPGFNFPYDAKLWLPLGIRIEHNSFTRPVVGRLKPGVWPEQAQAELTTFAEGLALGPGENKLMPQIMPLKELLVANIRQSLLVFAGAVGFVLLIACANVANLFLVRAAGRGQEIAVRSALGAGRWRLMRQLLTEAAMVSLAGGAVGVLLAYWGVPALIALAPSGKVPRMEMIRIDCWVLAFTFCVSMTTGIVTGLTPAFKASRRDAREALSQGGRNVTGGHEGIRRVLAISEVALALILLTGAGLMLKSFLRLRAVDPGFAPHNVVSMTVDLPESTYRTAAQMHAFHSQTLAELSNLPGVLAAGAVNWLPLGGVLAMGDFQVEGGVRPPDFIVDKPCVTPDYFRAMGIGLLRGREFSERDNGNSPGVVIVSQSVARILWPGEDPLGKRISMEDHPKAGDWLTVVGVVDDLKQQGLAKEFEPAIYQSYLQVTHPFFLNHMTFVVKTGSRPEGVASGMRAILRNVDKDQPASIATMDSLIAATTAEPRFQVKLLATFAIIALALTMVGIYGVLAYSLAQRTQEIGVRMALGAQSMDVLRVLLRGALVLICAGIAIGAAGSLALTRVLAKFLFEVKPSDPSTFAVVALALASAAFAACCIPARRAMKVDPIVALRYE